MAKPDYETLLSQIAAASGDTKTALELQCYVFEEELTDTEKIKEEADIYCDLYTYSYVELTDEQVEQALEDYIEKNNLKDNWGEEIT